MAHKIMSKWYAGQTESGVWLVKAHDTKRESGPAKGQDITIASVSLTKEVRALGGTIALLLCHAPALAQALYDYTYAYDRFTPAKWRERFKEVLKNIPVEDVCRCSCGREVNHANTIKP